MPQTKAPETFSHELQRWAKGKGPKTLQGLIEIFEERSFAVIILLLMLPSAVPLPTGGLTHVFEAVALLIALEQALGFRSLRLPHFLTKRLNLARLTRGKVFTALLRPIRWVERYANKRWSGLFSLPLAQRLMGLLLFVLIAITAIAPPYTGLDTLPAIGVVLICLAIILGDTLLLVAGTLIGVAGTVLILLLGTAALNIIRTAL